jgi:hypothetical protein
MTYGLRFQAPKNEKAQFRKGARVTCDYYPGTKFKVVAKEWGLHGELSYTIQSLPMGIETYSGIRPKFLNKA